MRNANQVTSTLSVATGRGAFTRCLLAGCLLAGLALQPAHADDAGKKSFERCIACHGVTAGDNGLGPTLHQVMGRPAGTAAGFRFSGPMKRSGIVWDRATLTGFLRNPQETIPGTRMPFSGMTDEAELQALVAYLESATR